MYTRLTSVLSKEKYRGVFEIQKSGDKTSSGEIGLDIRTHASPNVGQQGRDKDFVKGWSLIFLHRTNPLANLDKGEYEHRNPTVDENFSFLFFLFCACSVFLATRLTPYKSNQD